MVAQSTGERDVFTYEDFLALPEDERRRINQEIDAMPDEELRALGEKLANFIHDCNHLDMLLRGLDLE